MKRVVTLLALVAIAACSETSQDALGPAAESFTAPTLESRAVPGEWIVVFRPGVADAPGLARRLVANAGGNLRFSYEHTIEGFAATLPAQAIEGIRNNPNVESIQPDITVSLATEEPAASWGLDRIDQRSLPLSGTYVYESSGAGVTSYILDTGIRTSHDDFGGRASRSSASDFVSGDDRAGDDCNGHGTHVAGTVGGTSYGVAKAVSLVAVRVLGCNGSGSLAGVIAGVDWVTAQHNAGSGPSTANMSLSAYDPFNTYPFLDDAVAASVAAGVVFAVAASNDNDDACGYTPARESAALTAGSTTSSDARSSFSNYGPCVDLFAPGSGITSAYNRSDTDAVSLNGTSMASPHIAGVASLILGDDPGASTAEVWSTILGSTTDGVIANAGPGSPNKLLYSLLAPPVDPTDPPSAPTGLGASAVSHTQIDLSWTNTSSEQSEVEVERSTGGAAFALVATLGGSATSFSDGDVAPSTEYSYRVRAGNAAGESGYSNTASATTPAEPAPASAVPYTEGGYLADVEVSRQGKFAFGLMGVFIQDASSGFGFPGVLVSGDWYADGRNGPVGSATGVTDQFGFIGFESGRVKTDGDLHFCITSLSGSGVEDGTTYPACSYQFGGPGGDPGDPGEPGDPDAPSNLTANWTRKGGGRVELRWTSGGGVNVDIYRNGSLLTTTADDGAHNHRGGLVGDEYRVCLAGSVTECATATAVS